MTTGLPLPLEYALRQAADFMWQGLTDKKTRGESARYSQLLHQHADVAVRFLTMEVERLTEQRLTVRWVEPRLFGVARFPRPPILRLVVCHYHRPPGIVSILGDDDMLYCFMSYRHEPSLGLTVCRVDH